MADNIVTVDSKKQGEKGKIIIIILSAIILVLGGAVGFSLVTGSDNIPFISQLAKEPEPAEVQVPLEEFLINVSNESGSSNAMVKMEVTVSSFTEGAEELITADVAKVRDAIIHVVSNESTETLLERKDGSFVIKDDLKNRINESFGEELIDEVYITNILTQN
ncbi:flagellar basal body-associated FliL family protein [Marinilactibacillus piezotolerans]|uniref:flagellar basal body-associated FliL family protein n=1 Tax=Marinilactibacillus piezotolerans TaxID=258723 RepID=UPI0015C4DEA6|nr:flagellar basal body-associated FliL family protein [Marinilactibacillus piezotolerans]